MDNNLLDVLNDLHNGKLDKVINNDLYIEEMNRLALIYLNEDSLGIELNQTKLDYIKCILDISNILYNNTDITILPLDDGVYDLLLELYRKYRPAQVGAEPIIFNETKTINEDQPLVDPFVFVDTDKIYNEFIFGEDIYPNRDLTPMDLLVDPFKFMDQPPISKRTLNIKHEYPKLVGTLDKCKFVLMNQAEEKGVSNDSNVKVLERDFFQQHLRMGLINYNDPFTIIAELKYDGISVEATVTNRVLTARTRGDAVADIAADITPILNGYMFPYADPNIEPFGMKFEAIMTYQNLCRYNQIRNKNYKNCRTAISSIFASSDGYKYREFITLVPLATSYDIDRISEIEFMNTYYYTGEALRYSIIHGNYTTVLFQIKKFVDEVEYLRQYLPFMYDGVVLSYLDMNIRNTLGRVGAINKYSMAVKFTPLQRYTRFRSYEFTIGQDGSITPMIYYDPVEFYGTIHYKSSGHSYERFKELNLRPGDTLLIVYTNDVMSYVYKVEENLKEQPIPFIDVCPSCGQPIYISESGKSAYCLNINCPERIIKRLTGMMSKLNLNDFGEAYIKSLNVTNLTQMLNLEYEYVRDKVGDINGLKFIDRMNFIKTQPIYDYDIIGALGFTNIASAKWKLILNAIPLDDIITKDNNILYDEMIKIKGIGPKVIETIMNEREYFKEDLNTILSLFNIVRTYGLISDDVIKVRFTGFRDKEFMNYLISKGFDCSEGSVTSKTNVLLIPYEGFDSSKVRNAMKNGFTQIMTKPQFIEKYNL